MITAQRTYLSHREMGRKHRRSTVKKIMAKGPCPPGDVDTLSFVGTELDRLHKAIRNAKRAIAEWDEELDELREERAKKRHLEAKVMEKMGLDTQMLREPFETSSESLEEEEERKRRQKSPRRCCAFAGSEDDFGFKVLTSCAPRVAETQLVGLEEDQEASSRARKRPSDKQPLGWKRLCWQQSSPTAVWS